MKRRDFIQNSSLLAFSISAFGTLEWNGKFFETGDITTTDILGPFYRPGAPLRSDLIPSDSKGEILHLSGKVLAKDGKTAVKDALVEAWHCDENQHYDNTSDEYLCRGAQKTGKNGKYEFKTIFPAAYKAGSDWRPAHIHMRISSRNHQDLITQVYFKNDPYITGDPSAASPGSRNRILPVQENGKGEKLVKFDVQLGDSYVLDDAAYEKLTGLYSLDDGMAEFVREDDLLILKMNGQIVSGMVYKGNNRFEGGLGFHSAEFDFDPQGDISTNITMWEYPEDKSEMKKFKGRKILKYKS